MKTSGTQDGTDTAEDDEAMRKKLQPFIDIQRKKKDAGEAATATGGYLASVEMVPKSSRPQRSVRKSVKSMHIASVLRDVASHASQKFRGRASAVRSTNSSPKTKSPKNSKSSSSKRRQRRQLGALRLKNTAKKPTVDLNSLFVDLAAQDQPMTALAMEHQRKARVRKQMYIDQILSYVSAACLVIGIIVGTFGWLRVFLAHWEFSALESANLEKQASWKTDCAHARLGRSVNGISHTLPCQGDKKMAQAPWSVWTRCVNGVRYRWKVLKAGVSYEVKTDDDTFQSEQCQETTQGHSSSRTTSTGTTGAATSTAPTENSTTTATTSP